MSSFGEGSPEAAWRLLVQVVKTGDVIEFYNAVFIPATKSFLLQLGNKTAPLAQLPALSVPGTPLRLGTPLGPRSFSTPPAHDRLGTPGAFTGASPALVSTPGGKVLVSPMRQPQAQQVSAGTPPLTTHSFKLFSSSCMSFLTRSGGHVTPRLCLKTQSCVGGQLVSQTAVR